ncbi:MAG: radical SAM protein [Magnetococcales bacterium]|nr:radical SAM protein [Magnetococcales bacterium]
MAINYHMPLYRPPSEGENLIIQATLGCSFNNCTFCSMYHGKTFQPRALADVMLDIDQAASEWPQARRVFLADGDALVLPTSHLLKILNHLSLRLPKLTRVSSYALPGNLLKKSVAELNLLQEHKLTLLYYGIESGSASLLKKIRKGATPEGMFEGLIKAEEAQIKTSATVVLGLGGQEEWQSHIDQTVDLLQKAPVNYLSTLQLFLEDSVRERFLSGFKAGFKFQDDRGILAEQYRLIDRLTSLPKRAVFRSNHASNALALAGNLPKDRQRLLMEIKAAQDGAANLRPAFLRSL